MTGQSRASHEPLQPGDRLGAYEIRRPLGRGGMGAVFLAHDTILHRPVALKVLLAGADEGSGRNVLLNGIRLHPRFQQILDSVIYRRQQRAAQSAPPA